MAITVSKKIESRCEEKYDFKKDKFVKIYGEKIVQITIKMDDESKMPAVEDLFYRIFPSATHCPATEDTEFNDSLLLDDFDEELYKQFKKKIKLV